MNLATLHKITGNTAMADRKQALLDRVKAKGGPLNEPAVMAQFLAQLLHESGGFRYVREVWGPTKAQRGYEGRVDLGNVRPGDGARYLGRDLIQVTGRANYRALSKWAGFDFEAQPTALEGAQWLGIGAIWYFLTRKGLIDYARAGNIEMVTRRVNGGLNGYADRLKWYDRTALAMLGHADVTAFQRSAGITVDGISGPVTRAAMHKALSGQHEAVILATSPAAPLSPKPVADSPAPKTAAKPGWLAWIINLLRGIK